MDIKLVAIDMDGTLLNSKNQLTDRTRHAIERANKKGVKVVLATGRLLKSASYYADILNLDSYIAACNGALVVDGTRKEVMKKPIAKKKLEKVMEIGHDMSVYFHFYNEDTFFTRTYVKEIADYYSTSVGKFNDQSIDFSIYGDASEVLSTENLDVYKFLFIDENQDKLIELKKRLNEVEGISVSKSWSNNLEVMEEGVSKGRAMKYLSSLMDISPENIMAIGDNENDLPMLHFAGWGVAMGNGSSLVIESADYVTSTNDQDGVAKAIEKFVL